VSAGSRTHVSSGGYFVYVSKVGSMVVSGQFETLSVSITRACLLNGMKTWADKGSQDIYRWPWYIFVLYIICQRDSREAQSECALVKNVTVCSPLARRSPRWSARNTSFGERLPGDLWNAILRNLRRMNTNHSRASPYMQCLKMWLLGLDCS
jgi:hypothetical protein